MPSANSEMMSTGSWAIISARRAKQGQEDHGHYGTVLMGSSKFAWGTLYVQTSCTDAKCTELTRVIRLVKNLATAIN